MADVTAWFTRVAKLPPFVRAFGYVKPCQKAIKPPKLPVKEKPKVEKKAEPAQAASAKPGESGDAKPPKNPLDALPPSPFDLYNFKTYFVNVPDKAGEGHARMMAEVDNEGYSFWFLHYEKFGKEGQIEYQFLNLLEGFMQRLDGFRKHAFGRVCMTKDEPDLEIKGVLLVRGEGIPQELIDHPQWEYMQARKLDWSNDADMTLVREYMSSKEEGMVNGELCQMAMWHK